LDDIEQGNISPELIRLAYRLFLDREPESEEVVAEKQARLSSLRQLREEFLRSDEFRLKTIRLPSLSGDEPTMPIEDAHTQAHLERLFSHIQQTWQHLGEIDPYWSVLTNEAFLVGNIENTKETFYNTGEANVARLIKTLDRNDIDYHSLRLCLDYGCGVGRTVLWLSKRFEEVIGYDISKSHLDLAKSYLSRVLRQNITLRHITGLSDIENLPKVDLIYSVIVLRHNPPPIIGFTIRQFMRALNPGGVAYFQVPTYRMGYRFSIRDYLCSDAKKQGLEMHVFPQKKIFEIVEDEGARTVEVLEDMWTGSRQGDKEISNTFLVQKMPTG